MKLRRIVGWSAAGLAGYMTYKVVEVSTRPIPCQPLRSVRVPPEPVERFEGTLTGQFPDKTPEQVRATVEHFAQVLERRMDGTYRQFRADPT